MVQVLQHLRLAFLRHIAGSRFCLFQLDGFQLFLQLFRTTEIYVVESYDRSAVRQFLRTQGRREVPQAFQLDVIPVFERMSDYPDERIEDGCGVLCTLNLIAIASIV